MARSHNTSAGGIPWGIGTPRNTYYNQPGDYANYQHWVQSEFKTEDFGEILSSSKALNNGGASFQLTGVPETVAALNGFLGQVPELVFDDLIQYAELI